MPRPGVGHRLRLVGEQALAGQPVSALLAQELDERRVDGHHRRRAYGRGDGCAAPPPAAGRAAGPS
jgi:hypothetical protein